MENLIFRAVNVIFSHHFHENYFQIDMKAKLLGYEPNRWTVKPGALRTIFIHKFFHIINMNGETADGIRYLK